MQLSIEIKSVGPQFVQQVLGMAALCESFGWKIGSASSSTNKPQPVGFVGQAKRPYKPRRPTTKTAAAGEAKKYTQSQAIEFVLNGSAPMPRQELIVRAASKMKAEGSPAKASALGSQVSKMRAGGQIDRLDSGLFAWRK